MHGERTSEKIRSTAAYIVAAVLLVVLTYICRKLDAAFFSALLPLRPAEMMLEALIIASASVYIFKHRGKGLRIKIRKHVLYPLIPLILLIVAFLYMPDNVMTAGHGAVHILDMLLSAFAEDFVICTLGCILLIHIGNLKTPGIIIMLLFSAAYGAVVREGNWSLPMWIAVSVIVGFFVIQLHLSTESAVFCGIIHFLLHMAMHFSAENSNQKEPVVGNTAGTVMLTASLISMIVIGMILNIRRKVK